MLPTLRSLVLPLLLTAGTLHAQQWQWADPGASAVGAEGRAIATDAQGNSVVAGNYSGTVGFGGQLLSTPDQDGIFVAKFDPNGTVLWAHIAANGPGITVNGVTIDDAGGIAIVGMYQGAVAFIPGPIGTTLNSAGSFDVFVAKYASDGSPLWAHSIGGAGYDYGASIAHDGFFNIYVTGDLHEGPFNLSASKVFVSKFAYNGVAIWTTTSADYGTEHLGDGICANEGGDLCITGEFFGSITFGSVTLNAGTAEATIYVAKLNSDGETQWAQKAGTGGYAFGQSVTMDEQGNAYVTGSYRGTIALGALSLDGPGDPSFNVFVTKCGALDGTFQWATSGVGSSRAVGICTDPVGNSYINGVFDATWNWGSTALQTNGGIDGYVAKLSPSGDALWAKGCGGPAGESVGGIAYNGTDVFITGGYQGSMVFDQGTLLNGLPGLRDVFVAKLSDTPSGIPETLQPELALYPDPTTDRLVVQGLLGTHQYTVRDMLGNLVLAGVTVGERGMDVSTLAKGNYVICFEPLDRAAGQPLKFMKE